MQGLKQETTYDLIEKAQSGDVGAFTDIIRQYGSRIQAIAYQISGNSDDARDIAQEVFIRLWNSLGRFNPRFSFVTWLYRLTVNLSIDHLRQDARHRHESIEAGRTARIIDNQPRPDENAERNEFQGAIRKMTEQLSINQRRVFVLRDLQGFSIEEVAEILKCRPSTVRVHLARARSRVRDAMQKNFPDLMEENHR